MFIIHDHVVSCFDVSWQCGSTIQCVRARVQVYSVSASDRSELTTKARHLAEDARWRQSSAPGNVPLLAQMRPFALYGQDFFWMNRPRCINERRWQQRKQLRATQRPTVCPLRVCASGSRELKRTLRLIPSNVSQMRAIGNRPAGRAAYDSPSNGKYSRADHSRLQRRRLASYR